MVVCTLTIVLGYLFKARCANVDPTVGEHFGRLCYNDVEPLYGLRGVSDHVFPYVNAELREGELVNGAIEYPVLTGVFMWAAGLPIDAQSELNPASSYLRLTALLLAPFALLVAIVLERMRGVRALYWAAAPALILYAFHNWDLLVVAAAVVGLWLAETRRWEWASVTFGIGAAFKMYPLLFVAPLAAWCLRERGSRKALAVAGAGLGTFLLINLPFAVANLRGWLITYEFHSQRGPNFDTIWYLGFEAFGWQPWSPQTLNTVTTALMALAVVAALAWGWKRAKEEGAYPFMQVCAAMLAGFLLFNKVHSPQYTLWLLPFFALLPLRWYWWGAYSVVDLAVYVGIFRWFYDFGRGAGFEEVTPAKATVMAGVWARAALLAALFLIFLRTRTAEELPRAQKVSQPARTVGPGEQPAS